MLAEPRDPMLKYLSGFLFLLISLNVTAQSAASPKIRVLLVGSIHFTPSTQDAYQNKVVDVENEEQLNGDGIKGDEEQLNEDDFEVVTDDNVSFCFQSSCL